MKPPCPAPRPPIARTLRIRGEVPSESWNRFGVKVLPKLRNGTDVKVNVELSVTVDGGLALAFEADLNQAIADIGLSDTIMVE